MKAMNIKGKEYIPVNERIKEFRNNEKYNNYTMVTEIFQISPEQVIMKAIITDKDNRIVATGFAEEVYTDDYKKVNSTSMIENCETSAWGRALGNLGIGIDTSVASADEVENSVRRQDSARVRNNTNQQENVQREQSQQEYDKIWYNGEGMPNLFEHFMVGDIEYKTMKNKSTGELFGLAQDSSIQGAAKFYKLQ